MTTVTSPASAGRVAELLKVPSRLKGLSCEPVFAELNLDLAGSDVLAEPFEVEWALSLREQSRKAHAAFFLKQLGKAPRFQWQALELADPHGGDWQELPVADWRTREIPQAFRNWR
jgi:protein gp37